MNPVELTREDVERILALAIQIRERAMECDRVRFEMRHNTVFVLREAIRDVSNFAIEQCLAALRGMESQGVTDAMVLAAQQFDPLDMEPDETVREILEAVMSARTQPRGEK